LLDCLRFSLGSGLGLGCFGFRLSRDNRMINRGGIWRFTANKKNGKKCYDAGQVFQITFHNFVLSQAKNVKKSFLIKGKSVIILSRSD
jgi:hypothetical protein